MSLYDTIFRCFSILLVDVCAPALLHPVPCPLVVVLCYTKICLLAACHFGFEARIIIQSKAWMLGFSGQVTHSQPMRMLRILVPSHFYVACVLFLSHRTESEGIIQF